MDRFNEIQALGVDFQHTWTVGLETNVMVCMLSNAQNQDLIVLEDEVKPINKSVRENESV